MYGDVWTWSRQTPIPGRQRTRSSPRGLAYARRVLRPAASLADFYARPLRRHVAGRTFLFWVASPTLVGAAYFGRPSPEEWGALLQVVDIVKHAALLPPYDAVIDAGGLSELPLDAFEALVLHLEHMRTFASLVRRVAIVRPPGILGATLAGLFYERVQAHFQCALFQEAREAFAWLARRDAAPVAEEVTQLVDASLGTPHLLRRLRVHLATASERESVHEAARSLGVTERSLQRWLRDAGTSFRVESARALRARAERMLLEDDAKIEVVARRCGFHSASHLAREMRRHGGESPAEFRRRRRPKEGQEAPPAVTGPEEPSRS